MFVSERAGTFTLVDIVPSSSQYGDFARLIGPLIESIVGAHGKLQAFDQRVTNGVMSRCQRHVESGPVLGELQAYEADLDFWLPDEVCNAFRQALAKSKVCGSPRLRTRQVLSEVWVALEHVLARNDVIERRRIEQARRYPPGRRPPAAGMP